MDPHTHTLIYLDKLVFMNQEYNWKYDVKL